MMSRLVAMSLAALGLVLLTSSASCRDMRYQFSSSKRLMRRAPNGLETDVDDQVLNSEFFNYMNNIGDGLPPDSELPSPGQAPGDMGNNLNPAEPAKREPSDALPDSINSDASMGQLPDSPPRGMEAAGGFGNSGGFGNAGAVGNIGGFGNTGGMGNTGPFRNTGGTGGFGRSRMFGGHRSGLRRSHIEGWSNGESTLGDDGLEKRDSYPGNLNLYETDRDADDIGFVDDDYDDDDDDEEDEGEDDAEDDFDF